MQCTALTPEYAKLSKAFVRGCSSVLFHQNYFPRYRNSGNEVRWTKTCSHVDLPRIAQKASLAFVMKLAFQSIGVVYGDLGTSPLYVYSSTFTHGIKKNHDILGVLSLIIYTLITIPLIKYVFIVLRANDNGEGTCCLKSAITMLLLWF